MNFFIFQNDTFTMLLLIFVILVDLIVLYIVIDPIHGFLNRLFISWTVIIVAILSMYFGMTIEQFNEYTKIYEGEHLSNSAEYKEWLNDNHPKEMKGTK